MAQDPFSDPTSGGVKITDIGDKRLLLVTPLGYEEGIKTPFGDKDAVRANVVVIDEANPAASEKYDDLLIFQGRLIGSTKPKIGKGMVIGRLGQVPTDKGNPAWELAVASDAEKMLARTYLASTAPEL